jgi:Domain of unknown function (DUF4166)
MSADCVEAVAAMSPPRGNTRSLPEDPRAHNSRHCSIRRAIGETAWTRLPPAVRARFADSMLHAEYTGTFETVRASRAGKMLALLCVFLGTPVTPHTGNAVPATVRVFVAKGGGTVWERTYRFPGRRPCVVSSTKQAGDRGELIEALPFGLRMPLEVFESAGALHFVSRGYYFRCLGHRLRVPDFLPPGRTHVVHADEGGGWFRFTMTTTHKWFGEVYFQTGRFRAASEAL